MQKWFDLLIISALLFCLFSNVPIAEDISALAILVLGTDCIISEIKKPIKP